MFSNDDKVIDDFKNNFLRYKNDYYLALDRYRIENKTIAEDFNIFNILGVEHYEVSTHSSLLRELLDSNGSHGQGNLFFIEFLSMLSDKGIIPREEINKYSSKMFDDYICEAERAVDTGRIDIIIERLECEFPFCLIIENKIWAVDQEKQIERYWQELKKKKAPENRKKILYLSIDGHLPSEWSIDNKLRNELENQQVLYCISYKEDVKLWLGKSLQKIESEKVKYIIGQYIDVLKKLKEGSMATLNKNLYDFLVLPDNWQFAKEISEKANSAKEILIAEFLSEINNSIEKRINDRNLKVAIIDWDISINHYEWQGLLIKLEGLNNKPFIGIWYDSDATKLPNQLLSEIETRLKAIDQKMETEPGWLGWYHTGEEYLSVFDKILPSNRKALVDKYSSMLIELIEKATPILKDVFMQESEKPI